MPDEPSIKPGFVKGWLRSGSSKVNRKEGAPNRANRRGATQQLGTWPDLKTGGLKKHDRSRAAGKQRDGEGRFIDNHAKRIHSWKRSLYR